MGSHNGILTGTVVRYTPVTPVSTHWLYGNGTVPEFEKTIPPMTTSFMPPPENVYPSVGYSVSVAVQNADGIGPFAHATLPAPVELATGQPTTVSASHTLVYSKYTYPPPATSLNVSWAAPEEVWAPNTPITSFEIEATPLAFPSPGTVTHAIPAAFTDDSFPGQLFGATLTGLQPYTNYSIVVYTIGQQGDRSQGSVPVVLATREALPSASPANITTRGVTSNGMQVLWAAMSPSTPGANGRIQHYSVDFTPVSDPGCDAVTCVDAGSSVCIHSSTCVFGECVVDPASDGTACDDGDDSTTADRCVDGTCLGQAFHTHLSNSTPVLYHMSIDTHSHGAGFMPRLNEFWYPQWDGATAHRYTREGEYIGTFDTGSTNIMQVWGENDSLFYYIAAWTRGICEKRGPYPSTQLQWTFQPTTTSTVGGVSTDANFAYVMESSTTTVYVVYKGNGTLHRSFELVGGTTGNLQGGLVVAAGKLFYAFRNHRVSRYNLGDGVFDGFDFVTPDYNNNMAFTGQDICLSPNSDDVFCFRVRCMRLHVRESV